MNSRYTTLDLLKVLLTAGIVFRHSELVGWEGVSPSFDTFNRGMMFLTGACVPLFFFLSGFLFFRNTPERPDIGFFAGKLRKRVFSLIIPYVVANCVAFACYWLAHRFFPGMMSGYFGDGWKNPLFVFWTGPVNLSLWFIRDLIISIALTPLIWLFVRYTRIWGVIALGIFCWYYGMQPWYNFYFIAGAWAGVYKINLGAPDKYLAKWKISVPEWAPQWCFFIYLYHYIPVISLKKVLTEAWAPDSFFSLAGTYLGVALLTLALVSAVFLGLRKWLPAVMAFLVGGKR